MLLLRPRMLYAFALIMNSATGVLVVALPLLGIRFGANPLQLGVLGAAGAFIYTLACPVGGRLSDREDGGAGGRRRSLIMSCALLVLTDMFIFLVSGIRDLFILAVCGSFCAAFFWPPLQAWLAEVGMRDSLAKRLGVFNLSWSLGIMVGPMIGGLLFSIDYRLPWCYAIGTNSFLLLLLLVSREPAVVGAARAEAGAAAEGDGPPEAAEFLSMALWANFVCWFCLSNVQSLYPKLAVMRGFSPPQIGFLLFLVGLTQSVFFIVLRASRGWHFRYGPLVAVHAAAAAGMLIVFGGRSLPVVSLAFPLLGVGLGLSYYSSIYYSLCAGGRAGERTGVHEFMVGSAFFLGPLAGGACAQYIGLRTPFLICTALLAATAAWEALRWGASRRASFPSPPDLPACR